MRAANPSHALATVLVDELVRAGLAHACLAPGSRSAPLAIALHDDARVRLHVQIDERSAAFTALGLAKATRRPVAVVTTSGTAVANLHPAVVEAAHARVPLLVLSADRPPELRDTAANQTIDQVKLFGGAVRWFVEVGVPEPRGGAVAYWRSTAARAYATALGSPPGPVHLNVALRDPLVPTPDPEAAGGFPHPLDGRAGGRPWTQRHAGGHAPPPDAVERLAGRVEATERGLIVAGDAAGAGADALLALADVAGWPVLAEPGSGARAGELAVSTYHALLSDPAFAADHRPDLVLRVGRQGLSKPLGGLLAADVAQVLVDRDGAWLDPQRAIADVVAADPGAVAVAVAAAVRPRTGSAWQEAWQGAEHRARAALDAVLDAEAAPSEPRTARDLAAGAPDGATLVVASSMPVRDLDTTMRPRSGLRVLGNRGASGIDGFVSTALGAALAATGPTLALAGDLSVLHDQNGLLLASERRPDLVLVVVNNDGGGIFSFLPQAGFPASFERVFGTPHGVDFGRLAGVYGCGHARVAHAADLPAAVDAAVGAGGVQMVEIRTDRARNVTLHRRLLDAVARAWRPAGSSSEGAST